MGGRCFGFISFVSHFSSLLVIIPLQKETGDLVTRDVEKAEVLNDFFASFFTGIAPATPSKSKAGTVYWVWLEC